MNPASAAASMPRRIASMTTSTATRSGAASVGISWGIADTCSTTSRKTATRIFSVSVTSVIRRPP